MRIRKHYAKLLLGTDRPSYSPPPSPPPQPFDQYQHFLTHADGGAVCQLNCSPWDVLDFQEEEDEEEDYYGFKVGDETEEKVVTTSNVVDKCGNTDRKKIKNKKRKRSRKKRKAKVDIIEENTSTAMVVTTSTVVDKCGDTDRKKIKNKKRKRSRKKRKAKVDIIDESTSTAMVVADIFRICSKNNGKGWNCNRPSLPQQTLCDYHFFRLKITSKKGGNISHDLETDPPPPPIYSENNEHTILSRLRKRNPEMRYY